MALTDLIKVTGDMAVVNPLGVYPAGTVGAAIAPVPGADNTGVEDSAPAFNAIILSTALKGGGVIKPVPGTYKIGSPIFLPSYITLDLRGCTIRSTGSNCIESGYVSGGALLSNISEYGTGNTGNGTHPVFAARIIGGILGCTSASSTAIGIRGHRLNFGCSIEGVVFEVTLGFAWETSHSWGLRVVDNTPRIPAIMKDFVDWTVVEGNNFEGDREDRYDPNYTALIIKTGGYGGSETLRLANNGFHRLRRGVYIACESSNMFIAGNHFESVVVDIEGDNTNKRGFTIQGNWMKANLTGQPSDITAVTPMIFPNLRDSKIGPNRFSHDRGPGYDYYINANTSSVFGNEYFWGTGLDLDLSRINMGASNVIRVIAGSNSAASNHPEIGDVNPLGYTYEKYKAKYRYPAGNVPHCTWSQSGSVGTLKTWIPWDTTGVGGCRSLCSFNLRTVGADRSFQMSGHFNWNTVVPIVAKELYGGTDTVTLSISKSSDNFVQLVITGISSNSAVSGWIKEM